MSTPAPATSPPAPATNTTAPPPATPSAPPPATPSPPPPVAASPPVTTPSPPAPPPASTTPSPPPPAAATTPPPSSSTTPPPPSSTTPTTPSTNPSPPPPSSSTNRSPPPPTSSSTTRSPPPPPSTTTSPSPSSSTVSTGMVIGIAIAGVAVLAIVTLLFICCKKKRRRERDDEAYYRPPPPQAHKVDPYYAGPPNQNHVINAAPKPTPPPQPPLPAPPPPPPFIISSGGSGGSNLSGSDSIYPPPSPGISLGFTKSTFSYDELAMATEGFSESNLLGQGGFGYVHRGVLPNGKEVAVKSLKAGSGQGEREFHAEVEIISRVHHKHLVSLVGYCTTGAQRMLVYEFVPNDTMEFHLHGKGRPVMDWPTRLRIALGAAKGLAYLHEDCHPKIIHRDIKASNILVDFKFEAKVADFGLAKITSDTNTHVSTRVMGTFGYLAPEYAASGKLSEKSDVFSFGVMLLELITGRKPVDPTNTYMDDSLVDWARPQLTRALEDGKFDSLVDPRLQSDYNHGEITRMVACAAACVRHSARRRPRMSQIVRALEGDVSLSDLNEGIRPGQSGMYSSYGSSDYDTMQYNEDMKKFRKMALASTDFGGSSEYSEPTSEYGVYPSGSSADNTREMEMGKVVKKNSQGFSGGSQI